jgi:hypothetical protein
MHWIGKNAQLKHQCPANESFEITICDLKDQRGMKTIGSDRCAIMLA